MSCILFAVFMKSDSYHEWKIITMWIYLWLQKEEVLYSGWCIPLLKYSLKSNCFLNVSPVFPPHRLYFHISCAGVWWQWFGCTFKLLYRFWKVTKLRKLISWQVMWVLPANICLCVQTAICEHLPHSENNQPADCAAPRATGLLWLQYNGWWQWRKNTTHLSGHLGHFTWHT